MPPDSCPGSPTAPMGGQCMNGLPAKNGGYLPRRRGGMVREDRGGPARFRHGLDPQPVLLPAVEPPPCRGVRIDTVADSHQAPRLKRGGQRTWAGANLGQVLGQDQPGKVFHGDKIAPMALPLKGEERLCGQPGRSWGHGSCLRTRIRPRDTQICVSSGRMCVLRPDACPATRRGPPPRPRLPPP